jgi:PTH2 family peptidyl-tRNA hydrolase
MEPIKVPFLRNINPLTIMEELRMESVKQVIVVRKDLKMRKGKIGAQCAHAAMAVVMNEMDKEALAGEKELWGLILDIDEPLYYWLNGIFTKVVVSCNSEEELLELYEQAKDRELLCSLIQDAGNTEFNGVPTYTCIAIGPDEGAIIDEITGDLPLY